MRIQIVARQEEVAGKWSATVNCQVLEADSLDALVRQCREALSAVSPTVVEGADYEIVALLLMPDGMTAILPTATQSAPSSR